MPPIVGIYEKYSEYIKGQTIIRLHGPDRSGIKKCQERIGIKLCQPGGGINDIVKMIKDLQSRGCICISKC